MNKSSEPIEWWQEEYGFFGNHYLEGDDSKTGYLEKRNQTLEERTLTETKGVIKLLGLKAGQRVLDIPCGYGRHSIELVKNGMKLVGSDLNAYHLQRAKTNAIKKGVNVEFKKENMIDINYTEEFDAVINMFYSFGFFKKDTENFAVLEKFYRALKTDGKFLFHTDVNIPRILQGKYKEDEIRNLASGNQLRIIDKYDPVTRRINGSWIIKRKNGEETKKDYSVRVYTKDEFINLCRQAGFSSFHAYSDWDGSPYNEDAEDMIIVAERKLS